MTISGAKAKWLVAGAIVSMCLNLFLLAGIAGRMYGAWGKPDARGSGMIMATVPAELKPVIHEKLKARGPAFKQERDGMRQLRLKVADALAADPYDPAAFDAALAELEQSAGRMLHHAQEGLAQIAAELTPEQRKLWAEGWRKMGRHR
jgi:uncharacterized membrane protein